MALPFFRDYARWRNYRIWNHALNMQKRAAVISSLSESAFVLDSHFASDVAKFVSGAMACLSTMTMLELPHVNVLSKVDKIAEEDREKLEGFLNPDARLLMADLAEGTPERLGALNNAVANLLDDYAMVSFLPLDVRDEDTVSVVLMHCDEAVQFAENQEPRENFPEDGPDDL